MNTDGFYHHLKSVRSGIILTGSGEAFDVHDGQIGRTTGDGEAVDRVLTGPENTLLVLEFDVNEDGDFETAQDLDAKQALMTTVYGFHTHAGKLKPMKKEETEQMYKSINRFVDAPD